MITDLMYAHVKLDGVSIGFEDIEKTAEYAKFTLQASSLSKVIAMAALNWTHSAIY